MAYWQRERIVSLLSPSSQESLRAGLARISPRWLGSYAPLRAFDWNTAANVGLSSSLFDIEANIRDGDSRVGLDEAGMQEVHQMMQQQGIVRRSTHTDV